MREEAKEGFFLVLSKRKLYKRCVVATSHKLRRINLYENNELKMVFFI